ncbi:hypothetical protein [Microseira sp. BLCC-F43]|jgi:hypothetical protein|uniref:hypothetical protein n=1 Tax=Microseira sp. BLCC-F43 TaxID=3153602 RepID=UPI0035B892EF
MTYFRYQDSSKPWLVLFCQETYWHIIDRFLHEADAKSCWRGLTVFVKQNASTLKIININDPRSWKWEDRSDSLA